MGIQTSVATCISLLLLQADTIVLDPGVLAVAA